MNPNKLLGVSSNATAGEIQSAFRKAAMEVHPDHNSAPEAAEAFARIKEARDELMQRAEAAEQVDRRGTIQKAAANAAAAAGAAAFTVPTFSDPYSGMNADEITHIQELDRLVQQFQGRSLFARHNESAEVRRHRKRFETKNKRIMGKY
ncbi:MAG TPA: DnaJ domain-containing protein [Candidatus Saccharimonadaceae bacterium]|nr:DnaJ domain-containing protein [Candidatus Saccharimonadaceae bacterium]